MHIASRPLANPSLDESALVRAEHHSRLSSGYVKGQKSVSRSTMRGRPHVHTSQTAESPRWLI